MGSVPGLKAESMFLYMTFSSTVSKEVLSRWFFSLDKLESVHGILSNEVTRNLLQSSCHDLEICDGSEPIDLEMRFYNCATGKFLTYSNGEHNMSILI